MGDAPLRGAGGSVRPKGGQGMAPFGGRFFKAPTFSLARKWPITRKGCAASVGGKAADGCAISGRKSHQREPFRWGSLWTPSWTTQRRGLRPTPSWRNDSRPTQGAANRATSSTAPSLHPPQAALRGCPSFGNLPRGWTGDALPLRRDEGRESKAASACVYPAMQNVGLRSWEEICNTPYFLPRPTAAYRGGNVELRCCRRLRAGRGTTSQSAYAASSPQGEPLNW